MNSNSLSPSNKGNKGIGDNYNKVIGQLSPLRKKEQKDAKWEMKPIATQSEKKNAGVKEFRNSEILSMNQSVQIKGFSSQTEEKKNDGIKQQNSIRQSLQIVLEKDKKDPLKEKPKKKNSLDDNDMEESKEIVHDLPSKIIAPIPEDKKTIRSEKKKIDPKKIVTVKSQEISSPKKPKQKKIYPIFDSTEFRMLEFLGEGGFGRVMKAYKKNTNNYYALKFYKTDSEDFDFEEVENEDKILTEIEKLKEPKFLKYYGLHKDPHIKDGGGFLLVMESGEINLREVLWMRDRYELPNVLFLFNSLVRDLNLLQKNGIAARDIKTENIILTKNKDNPDSYIYKVSDFGIGALIPKNTNKIDIDDCIGCTKFYAAPEIIMILKEIFSQKEYDPFKSDVYSLALVIIELMGYKRKEEFIPNTDHPLHPIIIAMLEPAPEKRIDFEGVLKLLEPMIIKAEEPKNEKEYIKLALREKEEKISPFERMNKRFKMYRVYKELSHYKKASEILEECSDIYSNFGSLLNGSPQELELFVETGRINRDYYNKYEEALIWTKRSLELCKQLKGENSRETAKAYNEIAKVYDLLGDRGNAENLYRKALFLRESLLGEKDEDTGESYNCLALFYQKGSDYIQAENFYNKAINIYERIYGEEHSLTASSYNNIALFYKNNVKPNYDKAEEYFNKSLKVRLKLFGEEHAETASTYSNLGLFYKNIRKEYTTAEKYLLKTVQIRERILGLTHKLTGESYGNLANFYNNAKKDLEKAEDFYIKEFKIVCADNENEETATNYDKLASFFHNDKKDFKKAEECYLKGLNIKEKIHGIDHAKTGKGYSHIARFYQDKKEINKAETFFNKAINCYEKIYGPENHKTVKIKSKLNKLIAQKPKK